MLRAVFVASALVTGGCYIEGWVGAERTTLGADNGTGFVGGLSLGTVWGGPATVGAGLATTIHRGGGIERTNDTGVQARADVSLTPRLLAVATGNMGWVSRQERDGMSATQTGRTLGGGLGVGVVIPGPAYQQGSFSVGATYERWSELSLGADTAATAIGGELRFRWFWSSLKALGGGGVTTREVKSGGLGDALMNHQVSTPDAPVATPAPTCEVVTTCSYGAFGRTCSESRSCH